MTEPAAVTAPRIETFALGVYQTNCFVVRLPGGDAGWIVDCGYDPDPMLDAVERSGMRPEAILLTHAHCDHIAGVDRALARFGPLPLVAHPAAAEACVDAQLNLSAFLDVPITCTRPDRLVNDGDVLELDGTRWRVVHAPGHSPGSVLFVHDESGQAIVGDTLFAGSIGRIDFPTSDPAAMRRTIGEVLMGLPDDTTIHPGHGPATTIGAERVSNPFVVHGF
ncbi:MAG: MBL fold metallo-hydrolase [Planctomycetota bacterium]|jgi:glyoxylase-like metal-dependent hydrolase (beta-lactamase superfamily II)